MAMLLSVLVSSWMIRSSLAILGARPPVTTTPRMPFRSWTCHGTSQAELCDNLQSAGIIQNDSIVKSLMVETDRKHYMRNTFNENGPSAYVDAPFSIGLGQTISAPHMHARVLEDIRPHLDQHDTIKLLDVGCGSGYLTACLGRWCRTKGNHSRVFGIDIHTSLVDRTRWNIHSDDASLLDDQYVSLRVANGWNGMPSEAPFNAIHVGAAAEELPRNLAMQLCESGVLVIPIGHENARQSLYKIVRERLSNEFCLDDFRITKLLDVRYVPLVRGTTGRMNLAP